MPQPACASAFISRQTVNFPRYNQSHKLWRNLQCNSLSGLLARLLTLRDTPFLLSAWHPAPHSSAFSTSYFLWLSPSSLCPAFRYESSWRNFSKSPQHCHALISTEINNSVAADEFPVSNTPTSRRLTFCTEVRLSRLSVCLSPTITQVLGLLRSCFTACQCSFVQSKSVRLSMSSE